MRCSLELVQHRRTMRPGYASLRMISHGSRPLIGPDGRCKQDSQIESGAIGRESSKETASKRCMCRGCRDDFDVFKAQSACRQVQKRRARECNDHGRCASGMRQAHRIIPICHRVVCRSMVRCPCVANTLDTGKESTGRKSNKNI